MVAGAGYKRGRAPVSKVEGAKNLADLMTKNVDAKKCEEHLTRIGITFRTGQSQKASNLYLVDIWDTRRAIHERTTPDKVSHFIGLEKEAKHLSSNVFWRRTRDAETGGIPIYEKANDVHGCDLNRPLDRPSMLLADFWEVQRRK